MRKYKYNADSSERHDSGLTDLNAASVTTKVGGQSYANPVVLTASETVSDKAGGNITFQSTVNAAAEGAQGLGVSTDGTTTFAAPVGGAAALKNLAVGGYTTPASGLADLNATSVTTKVGGQSYANPVVLTASGTLSDKAGGNITFQSTVNAAAERRAGSGGLDRRRDDLCRAGGRGRGAEGPRRGRLHDARQRPYRPERRERDHRGRRTELCEPRGAHGQRRGERQGRGQDRLQEHG